MPRFDVSLWKALHPPSTEGSGIVAAVKEWQVHCPEKYDVPNANFIRVTNAVTPSVKKLLTAITDAENKLNRDKSSDAETKAKIVKTKALLTKWKTEATNYHKGVMKWWQDSMKEESEDIKNVARAQLEFTSSLVEEMQAAMSKLPALSKQFDEKLRARDLDGAQRVGVSHRQLLMKALYFVRPVAVALARTKAAAKFKVDPLDLKIPPKYQELSKKIEEMNTRDEDMADLLERAQEDDIDGDAEPGEAASPEYRKAARELATKCLSNAAKTKAKLSAALQMVNAMKQIKAIPAADAAYVKGVGGIRTLNQKMLTLNKEMHGLRDQSFRKGSSLQSEAKELKLTMSDEEKLLMPHTRLALNYTKRFVLTCEEVSAVMEDWLEEVLAAHPAAADVKGELGRVKARAYTMKLL